MIYGNKKSRIAHYNDCSFKSRISTTNLIELYTTEVSQFMGYRSCKCCAPTLKDAHLKSKSVREYCEAHQIKCVAEDNQIRIKRPDSEWIFTIDSIGEETLYHRNTCGDTSEYHVQKYKGKRFMSVLRYIVSHDEYRSEHPVITKSALYDPINYFFGQNNQVADEQSSTTKKGNWVGIKGTKRYKKMMKKVKERKRKKEIKKVLSLIEEISMSY